jgi:intracellular multiplication protein IcmW
MPDLSAKGAHEYWKQYPDPMIYRVVSFMESVETWCRANTPEFVEALQALSLALDDVGTVDLDKLGQQALFIQLGNHLRMAQTLRLLQTLDVAHPGSAAKLLMHAESSSKNPQDEAGLFLKRNIAFERLRLLARVFSSERLDLVLKALDEE